MRWPTNSDNVDVKIALTWVARFFAQQQQCGHRRTGQKVDIQLYLDGNNVHVQIAFNCTLKIFIEQHNVGINVKVVLKWPCNVFIKLLQCGDPFTERLLELRTSFHLTHLVIYSCIHFLIIHRSVIEKEKGSCQNWGGGRQVCVCV